MEPEERQSWETWSQKITQEAERLVPNAQPFSQYYRLKRAEMANILERVELSKPDLLLELGCGNAFVSSLVAPLVKRVVASDLPQKDSVTHSIGLGPAAELVKALPCTNLYLLGCEAENLPLDDDSVDVVLAIYVLHYIPDKPRVLSEIQRVLRPGGMAVVVVPNFLERVWAPVAFYRYLLGRVWAQMKGRRGAEQTYALNGSTREAHGTGSEGMWSRMKARYPHFPFPGPDGSYRNSWEELMAHRPCRWRALLEKRGLAVVRAFPAFILRFGFLGLFGDSWPVRAYEVTRSWIPKANPWPVSLYLSNSICLVAQKP